MRSASKAMACLFAGLASSGCCAFSAPAYHGPVTDHFDGTRFHNARPLDRDLGDLVTWQLTGTPRRWPAWVVDPHEPPPPRRVGHGEVRVTFVNHSTLLVQMEGLNVLTDPIWSDRAGPLSWAGEPRHRLPGVAFDDLPPIDVVLVSHNHYDHLDLPTLERVARRDHPRIFVGLGNTALLAEHGISGGTDLDWWQSARVGPLEVVAVPAEHTSMRGVCDRERTLWVGFVVRSASGSVFFAGDTGYGPHFSAVRRRLGPMRLALLPIGAYEPRWFMAPVHMAPNEAVQAAIDLEATTSVGMHFGTFEQTDEGIDDPIRDLKSALEKHPSLRFWVLGFGEGRAAP